MIADATGCGGGERKDLLKEAKGKQGAASLLKDDGFRIRMQAQFHQHAGENHKTEGAAFAI